MGGIDSNFAKVARDLFTPKGAIAEHIAEKATLKDAASKAFGSMAGDVSNFSDVAKDALTKGIREPEWRTNPYMSPEIKQEKDQQLANYVARKTADLRSQYEALGFTGEKLDDQVAYEVNIAANDYLRKMELGVASEADLTQIGSHIIVPGGTLQG